jgi:hypothetical protein
MRAAVLARDAVLALLPLIVLLLLHKWNPTILDAATSTWLFTGCFLWAVYRLLAILDPRLSSDAFKSILDVLQRWPKAKG